VPRLQPESAAGDEGSGQRENPQDKALKAYALAQLAQREFSRAELRRKLLARAGAGGRLAGPGRTRVEPRAADSAPQEDAETGAAAAQRVEAVLDWLEAHRYLSQQRFVESRIRVRCERFGNLRIRQELAQHGLTLPAQAEAALLQSEFERACTVWSRKFNSASSAPADAARQARFLAGRGFSGDVIWRVLRLKRAKGPTSEAAPSAVDVEIAPQARATLPR
jgi:regulatory protein